MEVWKDIIGFENFYSVSSIGRVKSLSREVFHIKGNLNLKEKILKQGLSSNGYLSVSFTMCSKQKTFNIHRLVAKIFIKNELNKKDVNHIDGNKFNNNVSNLEWSTRSENLIHAYLIGLKERGEKHPNAKLTEKQVLQIRSIKGISHEKIAVNYNVSRKCISKILNRETWKHI